MVCNRQLKSASHRPHFDAPSERQGAGCRGLDRGLGTAIIILSSAELYTTLELAVVISRRIVPPEPLRLHGRSQSSPPVRLRDTHVEPIDVRPARFPFLPLFRSSHPGLSIWLNIAPALGPVTVRGLQQKARLCQFEGETM